MKELQIQSSNFGGKLKPNIYVPTINNFRNFFVDHVTDNLCLRVYLQF